MVVSPPHEPASPRSVRSTARSELPLVRGEPHGHDHRDADSGSDRRLADLRSHARSVVARTDRPGRGGSVYRRRAVRRSRCRPREPGRYISHRARRVVRLLRRSARVHSRSRHHHSRPCVADLPGDISERDRPKLSPTGTVRARRGAGASRALSQCGHVAQLYLAVRDRCRPRRWRTRLRVWKRQSGVRARRCHHGNQRAGAGRNAALTPVECDLGRVFYPEPDHGDPLRAQTADRVGRAVTGSVFGAVRRGGGAASCLRCRNSPR